MKLAIIGLGNMGRALYTQWRRGFPKATILINNRSTAKIADIASDPCTVVCDTPEAACNHADLVVLGFKPQNLAEFSETKPDLSDKFVISLLAGVSLAKLQESLGARAVARIMPNVGVQVGAGATGYICDKNVTENEQAKLTELLKVINLELYQCQSEAEIDAVTALAGSGPAYYALFLEYFSEAATKVGLPRIASEKLALATLTGTAEYLKQTKISPTKLREKVTSPGGTTAAALQSFSDNNLHTAINEALQAAYARAQELNQ